MKYHKKLITVSVPLRGFCFSTKIKRKDWLKWKNIVSVPLRGFCFSTFENGRVHWGKETLWFPSPYGDFVFQRSEQRYTYYDAISFRPLTGILFFNNREWRLRKMSLNFCFRPLTGILFFNLTYMWHSSHGFKFPSPYGDFVFQRWTTLDG